MSHCDAKTASPLTPSTSAIPHWREKVWAWADEFELPDEEIPRNSDDLDALSRLVVDSNVFIKDISNLKKLVRWSLHYTSLEKIPSNISELTHLKSFWISDNNINELPESITELSCLNDLRIHLNNLVKLPENITYLNQLTTLEIDCDCLLSLPDNLGELTSLTTLTIGGNGLTHIP